MTLKSVKETHILLSGGCITTKHVIFCEKKQKTREENHLMEDKKKKKQEEKKKKDAAQKKATEQITKALFDLKRNTDGYCATDRQRGWSRSSECAELCAEVAINIKIF
ncbi:hypothetical protein D9C73_025935 [Collichthys lucidus]|uniref:Uncharacterized protein n=1 Tax=Collichthys lucidus TaxID=240159 RepID=A0A4U5VWL7_COLLU|nr:hypothetical protein D9C73_025935 [Collichthys lucidus]